MLHEDQYGNTTVKQNKVFYIHPTKRPEIGKSGSFWVDLCYNASFCRCMQNSSGSTNLLILEVRVQGLKGLKQFAKAAESKTALSAPQCMVSQSGGGGVFFTPSAWHEIKLKPNYSRNATPRLAHSPCRLTPWKVFNEYITLLPVKWLMNTLLIKLRLLP